MTAAHRVTDGVRFRLPALEPAGESILAITVDPKRDVALLSTDAETSKGFPVTRHGLPEPVLTMGYPSLYAFTKHSSAAAGQVSGTVRLVGDPLATTGEVAGEVETFQREPMLVVSCPAAPGSGGGPVIGELGAAIGIVSRLSIDQKEQPIYGFAICTPLAQESGQLLSEAPERLRFSQETTGWIRPQ